MRAFHWSGAATVVAAAGLAGVLLYAGPTPARTLRILRELDESGYAAWYALVLCVPFALLLAAAVVRRSPWPWVAVATVHLAGAVALAVRLRHWLPGWGWPLLAASVAVGLVSVAAALAEPPTPAGESRALGGVR